MPPSMDDDAMAPLVPRTPPRGGSTSSPSGILTNRILTILSLVGLVAASIYFQSEMTQMGVQLDQEESQLHKLQVVVDSQAEVIERFNNSVTNSDVLDLLNNLEIALKTTQTDLKQDLEKTERNINKRLNNTLDQLAQTVTDAQLEIEQEVDRVKKDVESYVLTTQDQFSMENSFMVYQLAGTFTLLSGLISMWHMTAHLRRFNQPVVQRKILAILWMCPIYAITSWFSLVFNQAEGYLAIIKDFYEAYVIYQFLSFCIAVLGRGDREAVVDLLTKHANHLTPPFRVCGCCFPDPYETDRALADAVLMQCQRFAMQFVFLRPLTSIVMEVLHKMNYYGRGTSSADYRSPQFYIVGVQNFSVFVAFTGLLKFYHAVDSDLAWCRPFAKFLCIKGVVFMTFWQGLAISILASTTDVGGGDAEQWAKSAQNFLICLEMLLFSIAHFYTFPTEEWEEGYRASHDNGKFGDSIALGDFMQDLKLVLKSRSKRKKRVPSEPTVPEEGEDGDDTEGGGTGNGPDSVTSAITADLSFDEEGDEEVGLSAKGIADILNNDDDGDEEMEEAARRLLSNKMLGENQGEDAEADFETGRWRPEPQTQGSNTSPLMYGSDHLTTEVGYSVNDSTQEGPANETTSLLGAQQRGGESEQSPIEELLRPSIFTTIASISHSSRMNFN